MLNRIVLGLAILALPAAAAAQPVQGLYFGAGAGVNLQPGKVLPSPPAAPGPTASLLPGTATRGAVGYGFAGSGLPIRIELEGVHLGNRVN